MITNFREKNILGQHIKEYHIACSMLKKVFPDINSIPYHIEAVYEQLKQNHSIKLEILESKNI